jgi:hypothetical protein
LAGTSGVSEIPIRDDALTQPEDAYCELPKHNAVYTNLLKIYENTTRINIYLKVLFKFTFFIVAIYIWLKMVFIFNDSFYSVLNIIKTNKTLDSQAVLDLIATFIPPLVSLTTSFIIIPKIIAKYLFNIKEEKSMVEIINNLQRYDTALYGHRYKERLTHNPSGTAPDETTSAEPIPSEAVPDEVTSTEAS